jgi:hypothetical protein
MKVKELWKDKRKDGGKERRGSNRKKGEWYLT